MWASFAFWLGKDCSAVREKCFTLCAVMVEGKQNPAPVLEMCVRSTQELFVAPILNNNQLLFSWRCVSGAPRNYLLFPFWTATTSCSHTDVHEEHPGIICCSHCGCAHHSSSGEDLSSSCCLLCPGTGILKTLGLPPLQQRFCSKTELLSALSNLQVCSLAEN